MIMSAPPVSIFEDMENMAKEPFPPVRPCGFRALDVFGGLCSVRADSVGKRARAL